MQNLKLLEDDLGFVMSMLKLELTSKLEAQGRKNSNLAKNMDFEIEASANVLIASMYMDNYYIFLEKGVSAARIPYTRRNRGQGRGGTSKYIQGLISFFRRKGLPTKEATSASFATANKHKSEGMPTRKSFRFSRDGTRLGFVESTLMKFEDDVVNILERRFGDAYEIALTNTLLEIADNLS